MSVVTFNNWPNQLPVIDGIVPVDEIPQDADFLSVDDTSDDLEMED